MFALALQVRLRLGEGWYFILFLESVFTNRMGFVAQILYKPAGARLRRGIAPGFLFYATKPIEYSKNFRNQHHE